MLSRITFQNLQPPIWVPKPNPLLAKANTAGCTQTHKTQMPPACMLGLPGKYKFSHVSSQPAQEWPDMSIAMAFLFI